MRDRDARIYREILQRVEARWITVRSQGLQFDPDTPCRPDVVVQIVDHSPARTRYRDRQPICRSLDGVQSIDHPQTCDTCPARQECTAQVRIDVLVDGRPWRLLLAFTSAKNFLFYLARLGATKRRVRDVRTRIRVVSKRSWGEVRFDALRSPD